MTCCRSHTYLAPSPIALALVALLVCGCESVVDFPLQSRKACKAAGQDLFVYDVNGDGHPDYWQGADAAGRIVELRFDENGDVAPDKTVRLDAAGSDVPHLVIALDGVPFDLVRESYQRGRFRLFYPPAQLISCFPSMTDLAFSLVFDSERCLGCEALYFDRASNKLSDGNAVYLSGTNAKWASNLAYRCSFWWDANAYLNPQAVFEHELRGLSRAFRRIEHGQAFGYTVGTAGLGTRGGRDAIIKYLETVDRLCEQIVHRRKGQVRLTLLADHGHNLARSERISLKRHLREAGFNPTKRLDDPKDVVVVEYGLVTYAALSTNDPPAVAEAVLTHPGVELVAYSQGGQIVVRDGEGLARVAERDGRYRYQIESGDPLQLAPVLENLAAQACVSPDGWVDDRVLFDATVTHMYPDPLHRLWLAFNGLVRQTPDVLVCLRDGYAHGSKTFDFFIGGAASTHGSLNRASSTTFAMTMLGELPAALRPEQVLPALDRLQSAIADAKVATRP
ncbi:MAG TPA: hypothetical protein VMZ31_13385 [Phycisphaerae bacterium]|nr:hypothetical protein [Phycisphaerae bacterium]